MQKVDKGYLVGLAGVVLTLLWIGIYKFTPTEAGLIKPLVASHPLMNWLYSIFSDQAVSNIIGIAEIIVAIGLIIGLKHSKIGLISGIAATIIFIATFSFLFTKLDSWKIVDGMPITNFFLLKDLVFIGIALITVEMNYKKLSILKAKS